MLIQGVSQLCDRYDHFILDIFGVLHNGIQPFTGTREALEKLLENGKRICLLSNTPRRAAGATQHMEKMNLERDLYHYVMTSGEAVHEALLTGRFGQRCWYIGTDIMADIFENVDVEVLEGPEGADFIINSIPGVHKLDDHLRLEAQLAQALRDDLPMICANPDLVVNIGDVQYECAGTFAKMYEERGGRVTYFGKPHAPVYERCWDLLGRPDKSKIVAIGDSFHTDIAGAAHFGIDTVFNMTGIHWEETQLDHAPGQADLDKIRRIAENHPHHPDYVMAGLKW